MVYVRRVDNRELTLGVSGRLLENNLLMWDPETNSLWSQIGGEAIHGPRAGKRLEQMPAIFVGLGTWKTLHPDTSILDLSAVPTRTWHYTTQDLARGHNEYDEPLGIGLRDGESTLLVPLSILHRRKLVQARVGRTYVAVVWIPEQACALVYHRRLAGRTLDLEWRQEKLWDRSRKIAFDPLTGSAEDGTATLVRFPYIPTTIPAWVDYYPGQPRTR